MPAASPWTISPTYYCAPDRQDARSHQWNLEIQRQLSENMMASVGYVGSVNKKVDVNGLANVALTPGPGTSAQVNARKPYPWMGTFHYDNSIGVVAAVIRA